jgi:hypothetical protein
MRNCVGVLAVLLGGLLLSSTAQASMMSRMGGAAAYDTELGITWLTNPSALNGGNLGTFATMKAAVADFSLEVGGLVIDDWRLPEALHDGNQTNAPYPCVGTNTEAYCTSNEMSFMLYRNLEGGSGNGKTGDDQTVDGIAFTGIKTSAYWSGTEVGTRVLVHKFSNAQIYLSGTHLTAAAWAVRDGDVGATVPAPATLLLVAAGLLGLGASRRRRH